MKIACEFPVKYQEALSPATDFDFVLTHLVLENAEYRDFYKNIRQETSRESILDCSIFELGQALSDEKVIEAAEIVNPSLIISPDVLFDSQATLRNLDKFLGKYSKLLEERNWKLAAVLQGNNLEEVAQVYKHYCSIPLITCICLPFSMILSDIAYLPKDTGRMVSRLRVTSFLEQYNFVDTKRKHHLLGASYLSEVLLQKQHSWITSIDTSAPIVAEMLGVDAFKVSSKLLRPENYFEYPYDTVMAFDIAETLGELSRLIR